MHLMPAPYTQSDGMTTTRARADLRSILGLIRRRSVSILLFVVGFVALALVYLQVRTPSYTAVTQLLIYNAKLSLNRDDAVYPESQLDPVFLETQMDIIKSEKIAVDVVDRLHLASKVDEKIGKGAGLGLRHLFGMFATAALDAESEQVSSERRRLVVLKRFQNSLTVERVGLGYVVAIKYTDSDPDLAMNVANETARAYVAEQSAARAEAAQSASAWLRERFMDLGPRTRIVASASRPNEKSNPSGLVVLATAAMAGLGAGVASAIARELLDRKIRTPEQAATAARAECLGIVPVLHGAWKAGPPGRPAEVLDQKRHQKLIRNDAPPLSEVLDRPGTTFWHTLRHVQVALDTECGDREGRCLGVTSSRKGEGKTVVAANFSRLIASTGRRTLLVDCNHHGASLSRAFCPTAKEGLIDVLESAASDLAPDFIWHDTRSGLHFLPIGAATERYRRSQIIWSEPIRSLIPWLSRRYEYLIFDLPALGPDADVRASSEVLDHLLLVMEWGVVTAEHMQAALASAGTVQDKLIGVVLNRVNVVTLGQLPSPTGHLFAKSAVLRSTEDPISSPIGTLAERRTSRADSHRKHESQGSS